MTSNQLIDVVQQLEWDCQRGKFVPYEEGDLRAEAYARLTKAVHGTKLVVNTEVRFRPYGDRYDASRCDVVVWEEWPPEQNRLNLNLMRRKPKLAVEFKYWGDAPGKMISYFKADIARLAKLGARANGIAFLYVARAFRDHDGILEKARSLGGRYGIRAMVVDGTKVTA